MSASPTAEGGGSPDPTSQSTGGDLGLTLALSIGVALIVFVVVIVVALVYRRIRQNGTHSRSQLKKVDSELIHTPLVDIDNVDEYEEIGRDLRAAALKFR